jgi:hypothetical protein
MSYIYCDGGRSQHFKGTASDCAARAMAIALDLDYMDCYRELAEQNQKSTGKRSARGGIYRKDLDAILRNHGWEWRVAPQFEGRKARASDMPTGPVVARMARHFAAIIDGVPHDIFDSSDKMIYGYWIKS